MQLRSYAALSLILTSLLAVLALGGCGYNSTKVCTLAGCCGPASDACAVPQFLYALGLNGQVSAFPINASTGIPGAPVSTPGPTNSLGMAALNNQFLYVSNPTLGGISSIAARSINLNTGALTTVPGVLFRSARLVLAPGWPPTIPRRFFTSATQARLTPSRPTTAARSLTRSDLPSLGD